MEKQPQTDIPTRPTEEEENEELNNHNNKELEPS